MKQFYEADGRKELADTVSPFRRTVETILRACQAETSQERVLIQPIEQTLPVVNSYNEWTPRRGHRRVADWARIPGWHAAIQVTMPERHWDFFAGQGGKPFPRR